jgi:hypothetical protein
MLLSTAIVNEVDNNNKRGSVKLPLTIWRVICG